MKAILKKDLKEKCWDFNKNNDELVQGLVCNIKPTHGSMTIVHEDGRWICDLDSDMARDYFDIIDD